MAPEFRPGRELSAAFYSDVVGPLLGAMPHAAALLGTGSDVLGYDTARSTDHGWGPRMHVFVAEADVDAVRRAVGAGLPERFRGWPVRFGSDIVPVQPHVRVGTLDGWLRGRLGTDPRTSMELTDWLVIPQQILLEVTRGLVHHDPDGELRRVQDLLARFPPQVRLWLLACQWTRVAEEEAFVGRAAEVGDELGSRIIAARLARELMRLAFLLAGHYWPYSKWLGTAFARLPIATDLAPPLLRATAATDHPAREAALVEAYEMVARAHNTTGLTAPVDPATRPYFDRPFRVLGAGRFVDACQEAVADPLLRALPLIGSVDQVSESTDVLSVIGEARRLRGLYER